MKIKFCIFEEGGGMGGRVENRPRTLFFFLWETLRQSSSKSLLSVVSKRWFEFSPESKFPYPLLNLNLTPFLPQFYLRYFRNPYGTPRPTEPENPPATKKEIPKFPKTPIIPKSGPPIIPKSRRPVPKSRRPFSIFREFLKNLEFLKFLVGGSRSQGFRKYLSFTSF